MRPRESDSAPNDGTRYSGLCVVDTAAGLTEPELLRQLIRHYHWMSDGCGRLYKIKGLTPLCLMPGEQLQEA
jgi:hypothetical protein